MKLPNGDTKAILWLLVFVVVVSFASLSYGLHKANVALDRATAVQCRQKEVFLDNADGASQLLIQHPKGFPTLGLGRGVFLRSIATNTKQANAINGLGCPIHTVEHNVSPT